MLKREGRNVEERGILKTVREDKVSWTP